MEFGYIVQKVIKRKFLSKIFRAKKKAAAVQSPF